MKKSTTINKGSFSRMARLVLVAVLTLAFLLEMVPAIAAPVEVSAEELTFGEGADAMTESELNAYIDELYQNETGTNNGRLQKMQAFILELALHAKKRDPNFVIIPQDGIALAYKDGTESGAGLDGSQIDPGMKALVDGWGIEGTVGYNTIATPSTAQRRYAKLAANGFFVTDTSTPGTQAQLDQYYANAEQLGIVPYPRIGGTLSYETLFPGWRWSRNSDYFWIEDLHHIGLGDRVQSAKDINKLTDAKNYLYHINGRPFDAWETWDAEEEAAMAEGWRQRTEVVSDGYSNGLLVPSEDGPYTLESGSNAAWVNANAAGQETGGKWDWWWRDAGYTADQGRQVWIETLKNSDYDVIYVDAFYNHRNLPDFQTPMTPDEIEYISTKPGGGRRKIIAYLNVGAAEQNRWYCQDDWTYYPGGDLNSDRAMKYGSFTGSGANMVYTPNPDAPYWLVTGYGGAYDEEARTLFWDTEWRDIIINGGGKYSGGKFWDGSDGDNTSSLDRIMDQGFDGVYLDNVGSYSSSANNYAAAQRWFNAAGKEVVSNFEFKTPGRLGKTYKTSARQSNGTMIPMPNISVAAGKRIAWTVTASTHPDVEVGDIVVDPTTINVLGSIKFEAAYVDSAVTDVTLDQETLALKVGATATLEATVAPADAVNKEVTWTTSNAAVADVVDGVVTAKKAGEADITVTTVDGDLTAVCKVTVSTIPATSITLNHKTLSLKEGTSQSLGTTIAPANVTSHHKTWKSSNPAVATVDSVGKITAVKVGTTDITVTATDGQKSAVCKVTVTPAKIAKPAKVTKVKAKVGKTKANISWKKASKATGYQIIYSTDKKFKAGKQTKTITINKAVTKKLIKQLQSGKTYYFRVRAGNKDANGKMQYGKWSNKAKAKIK